MHTHTARVAHTAHPHHLETYFFGFSSAETLEYMSKDSIMQKPCLHGLVLVLFEIVIFDTHTYT